jgi:hypothetical protein
MPDLDRISVQMDQLAELMTGLAKSWQQSANDNGVPGRKSLTAASELTLVEIDTIASSLLAMSRDDTSGHAEKVEALRYDVATRTAIDLATGILMERHGIDADAALLLLEGLTDRVTIATVAEGVVRVQTDETLDRSEPALVPDPVATKAQPAIESEPLEPRPSES